MPRGLTTLLYIFSTRDLVLILVSIDGFRPLKVTHLLTPRMGVAAGRARAGAGGDTANWRCAGCASWRPPLGLPHRHHEQSDHRHRPSDGRSRDYLFLIEWQSTNQPTNPPTKRATSEASEPSKQPVLIPLKRARGALSVRPSVSPSSVVDLLRLDLTDFEFEKSNRFARVPTRPQVLAPSASLTPPSSSPISELRARARLVGRD